MTLPQVPENGAKNGIVDKSNDNGNYKDTVTYIDESTVYYKLMIRRIIFLFLFFIYCQYCTKQIQEDVV